MASPGSYKSGVRSAKAGMPRKPRSNVKDPAEWMRGFDSVKGPAGESLEPTTLTKAREDPSIASPALDATPDPVEATGDSRTELLDAVQTAALPTSEADLLAGNVGGTCYTHGLGSQQCAASMPDGSRCPRAVVRPMSEKAAKRIAKNVLATIATTISVVADVPDPGVEESESDGVGAGLHAASERFPWLNENVADFADGALSGMAFGLRMGIEVKRAKKKGLTRDSEDASE